MFCIIGEILCLKFKFYVYFDCICLFFLLHISGIWGCLENTAPDLPVTSDPPGTGTIIIVCKLMQDHNEMEMVGVLVNTWHTLSQTKSSKSVMPTVLLVRFFSSYTCN